MIACVPAATICVAEALIEGAKPGPEATAIKIRKGEINVIADDPAPIPIYTILLSRACVGRTCVLYTFMCRDSSRCSYSWGRDDGGKIMYKFNRLDIFCEDYASYRFAVNAIWVDAGAGVRIPLQLLYDGDRPI